MLLADNSAIVDLILALSSSNLSLGDSKLLALCSNLIFTGKGVQLTVSSAISCIWGDICHSNIMLLFQVKASTGDLRLLSSLPKPHLW